MTNGPRVLRPDRGQLYWDMVDLESQIEPGHLARVVWEFVDGLDLSELYDAIKARDDIAGRPTPDPKVLLALWLYATLDGIGSARALERLCHSHAAYRWLRGGVPVNYHGLSDFRTLDGAMLDRLLTETVTVLVKQGLVRLDEVVVDGTKLKANAGRGSFRDGETVDKWEQAAQARVERLKSELSSDAGASERRRRAAAARAVAETARRAAEARHKLQQLRDEKAKRAKTHKKQETKKKEPVASTTDPEARIMKMADGGFGAAYNLLLAVAPKAQIICGLEPTDRRKETGLAQPMIEQFERRYGRRPARLLVDTGLACLEDIVALAAHPNGSTTVYAPPTPDRANANSASVRKREWRRRNEPEAVKQWRERMASAAGQLIYARRRLIEPVNGQLKELGLRRLTLRGFLKVRCEALLYAIAHNIRRGHVLRLAAT
ncbi:MAG: IS1182 family transposase [Aestuariivirgaceae bacterium]